jgi:hypothetical protein
MNVIWLCFARFGCFSSRMFWLNIDESWAIGADPAVSDLFGRAALIAADSSHDDF